MRYPTEAACSIFLNSKADMSKMERPWTCVHDLFYFMFINETTIYCVYCKIALTYLVGNDMIMT